MNTLKSSSWGMLAALMLVMAATRFNHFGSSVALPDATLALFFLGGLYLSRYSAALWIFAALLLEAALIDCYAVTIQGVSAWCITPAYGFLGLAYAVLWFAGRWFAPRHALSGGSVLALLGVASLASVSAFVISNVSFFLFSGRYAEMSAAEYATRVSEYLVSYVVVAVLYVFIAVAAQMIFVLLKGKAQHRSSHVA